MQFATSQFAAFFLVVLTLSWAVRKHRTAQKLLLLGASYWFYAGMNLRLLGLIVASSLANWALGEALARASSQRARLAAVATSVIGNLCLLGFFKYYNFFREGLDEVLAVAGLTSHLPILEIFLPLGISFYTFQSIAYCVDLYRGHGHKARSLLDFLLFIGFFPQLLIGPICRSADLLPQFEKPAPDTVPDLELAATLILSGLFKKVILASILATHLVDDCFVTPENYSSLALLVAAYGYTIQIYCDFSGYTDMARGIGLLMGVHLPENFNNPYAATNIGDFWRRWHISFSRWLRDYIYFPLGGSKVPRWRTYLNLMITMLLGGLWHGAHVKYIAWGAIHGAALVGHKFSLDRKRDKGIDPRQTSVPRLILGWVYTFHLCVLARIFFRAGDMDIAWVYWRRLLALDLSGQGFEVIALPVIAIGLGMNFYGADIQGWFLRLQERLSPSLQPLVWAAAGFLLLLFQPSEVAPYIYFQF